MLVSWEWLSEYVELDVDHSEMATRWALTGLNHESTEMFGNDPVIDLEVTSNRGDCLGHIGIAREASVLQSKPLRIPTPTLTESTTSASTAIRIENRFAGACPRYIGRVIRGIRIGNSPDWLRRRLEAIGVKPVNNVVDITNYVMFECGQPLHAFDLSKIRGNQIIIRPAADKENFVAIDHRNYVLDSGMVVIADAERAVALGGVMGGVDSEVSPSTVDLLIEAAEFMPMPIRRAARKLKLHSPSSYRYERRIDRDQLDWASRRCCELILKIAGGTLLAGSVDTGAVPTPKQAIALRCTRVAKVLGIDVPWERSLDILKRLGCEIQSSLSADEATVIAPSFRSDLTREIDLIEEIARIHGYDQIPEDAMVPMVASMRRPKDIVMNTVRTVSCAYGFDETLTPSLIGKSAASIVSPWSDLEPMSTLVPLLEGASVLRRSLIPSLIAARLHNQSQALRDVQLFECANVYLPRANQMPLEQFNLGLVSDVDIRSIRGTFEEILHRACGAEFLQSKVHQKPVDWSFLVPDSGIAWYVDEAIIAWSGQLSRAIADALKVDGVVAIGELNLDLLFQHARLVPQLQPIVPFPTIQRDLNLIVDESLQWGTLQREIALAAGPLCIDVAFREVYRDTKKDGAGKKRMLLSLMLRSPKETLTSDQADEVVRDVLAVCSERFSASLLG